MQTTYLYRGRQTVQAFRLPELGEDVPDHFPHWAESVGLCYTSGRDGELEILTKDIPETPAVASPGQWIVSLYDTFLIYSDEIFQRTFSLSPDMDKLERFLNGAAQDGLVCGGVDAADLYGQLFPEKLAKALENADPNPDTD